MKLAGFTEKKIVLRAFPFFLAYSTKEWLYYLPSRSITTWIEMKCQFLEKYFPASKANTIYKKTCKNQQMTGEILYEF